MRAPLLLCAISLLLGAVPPLAHAATFGASLTMPNNSLGLIGHWTFDGKDMVRNIADTSGQGNNAWVKAGATTTTAGRVGQALLLGVTKNTRQVRTFNTISLGTASVAFWFKYSGAAGSDRDLIALDDLVTVSSPNTGWLLTFNSANQLELRVDTSAGQSQNGSVNCNANESNDKFIDGGWHFAVLTLGGGVCKIYEDANVRDTGTYAQGTGFATPTPLQIGDSTTGISGSLDDVRLYNRILSPAEVAQLYNQGTATHQNTTLTPPNLANGLVGHWTFDGKDMVRNVADTSGQGNNGYLAGVAATSSVVVPGILGQALTFGGSSRYVTTGYTIPAQSSATSFTWSVWAKLASGSSGTVVILGFRNGATWVKLTPSALEYSAGSIISHTIPTNAWVHLTIVKNGSSFTYYQDGAAIGSATNAGSVGSHTFFIGPDPGFSDGALNAALDDVRVYNRALSPSEVAQLYNQGTATHQNTTLTPPNLANGLVGHWTFDGKDMVRNVADTSGQGNNGHLVGFTSTTTLPGPEGQALSFNGADYINMGNVDDFTTGSFTWSVWVKYGTSFGNNYPGIMAKNVNAASPNETGWHTYVASGGNNGKLTAEIQDASGHSVGATWGTASTDNTWHLAVGVVNRATNTIGISVDGGAPVTMDISAVGSVSNGANLVFGMRQDNVTFNYYQGAVDDARIWDRALSQAEIKQLYNVGH